MMASSPLGISDLPDEVLCEVFSKLTPWDVVKNVINVCKRWNTIVNENKIFWNYLQLTVDCEKFFRFSYLDSNANYFKCPNEGFIGHKDLDKLSKLQCIRFVGGGSTNEKDLPIIHLLEIMNVIKDFCTNLEKFEFSACYAATLEEYFKFLRKHYSNITEIRFGINAVHRIPYIEISKFHYITTLVSHDYALKKSDLTVLADSCSSLTCLWILLSRSLRVDDMLYFLDKKKTILKELGIGMNLHDCILEKLKECEKLEVIFAADARYITDDCIKSFCNLPKLKYCSLHRAVFEVKTVLGLIMGQPLISKHLLVLDLTNYGNIDKYVTPPVHKEDFFKKIVQVEHKYLTTFSNEVNSAIKIPWCQKSPLHWMYRNDSILRDFRKLMVSKEQQ